MSLLKQVLSRQNLPHRLRPGSMRWLWKDLETHYQNQTTQRGGVDGLPVPAFAAKFSPDGLHGHLLGVADEGGSVTFYDTRRLLSDSLVSEINCHKSMILDIAWVSGGNRLLTASGDPSISLWDVVSKAPLGTFKKHSASVKCVDSKKDEPSMFVSSSRDGLICLWDTRCSPGAMGYKPANSIASGHSPLGGSPPAKKRRLSDVNASVTAVLFHGDNKIASAGGGDGLVKLWDMRKHHSVKGKLPKPWLSFDPALSRGRTHGFAHMTADSRESFLFATCTDNIIYQYSSNGLITKPVGTFGGCDVSSFYVKSCLSPDDRFLFSGSSCGNAFIWEVDNPEAPPLTLPSTSPEVTAVSWCPSMDKLVTCTDECDMDMWQVARGQSQHAWGTRKCTEYTGSEHQRAQELLKQEALKENISPSSTERIRKRTNHNATAPATHSTHANHMATTPATRSTQSQLRQYFS